MTSRAGSAQATARGARPIVLAWAIVASIALHAVVLIATLPGGRRGAEHAVPSDLQATLVVLPAPPAPPRPEQPPITVLTAAPDRHPFDLPAPAGPTAPAVLPPGSARASPGGMQVAAAPLTEPVRLGGILARQMNEFPAEIDRPVRLSGAVVARYPRGAMEQGREDTVVMWVIVDATGAVEYVQVAEGSDEFAQEAIAAVRAARFLPAEDRLKPIRYPIALQFDFRSGRSTTASAAALAK